MKQDHFTLSHVQAEAPSTLVLRYVDGSTFRLDLRAVLQKHPSLAKLDDWAVFKTAQITDHGRTVQWTVNSQLDDNLELAADNLRARAVEQAGDFSHEWLWNWMHKHALTLDQAAQGLGISRRMLAYYRSGAKPLPLTVALACFGWESQHTAVEKA